MLTLGVARSKLSKYAPQAELTDKINAACELLLTAQNSKNSLEKVSFVVTNGILTLPRKYFGCIGVTVEGVSAPIYNQWYEFVLAGPGAVTAVYNEVVDLGDGWVTTVDISAVNPLGCTLRVSSDQSETDAEVLFKGFDADGEIIRTIGDDGPMDGESVTVGDTSTSTFASLSAVIKPRTEGIIKVYAVDGSSETLIATYEPNEERPSYRRYRVRKAADGTTEVMALCQRRHVEAVNDDDELPIDNLNALREALQSLQYRDQNDLERADQFLSSSLAILNREQKRFNPASTFPPPISLPGYLSMRSVY